jgi:MFS family permease
VNPKPDGREDRSYRALLAVPSLGRALLGMQIARVAQQMTGVAMILFTLTEYDSAALAGIVTFASIAPGLLVSPIAGALLDRHGRTRLIAADFLIALFALGLIGALALGDSLPVWLLLAISVLGSLTGPLSATGLRTLFPLMAPRHLWERLNAVDSNGYVVASIIGPPIAAVGVGLFGGPVALIAIALLYGVAAAIVAGVPEPPHEAESTGRLLVDAWRGLLYTWRNRTLRGLGFTITISNLANGMVTIVVPLIVLERLGLDEAVVGLVFAVQGIFGMASGFAAGRLDTRGRERMLIAVPTFLIVPPVALLLVGGGIWPVVISMALVGIIVGPLDVAMFTLRQRRTDPAWMGRAFAVSMSFNFAGYPVGAAIAGSLASRSIDSAIILGLVALVVGGLLALWLIPKEEAPMTATV